ncbi:MAG: VOC family protein [Caldisericales bacterium]|nr:VOC family protein [Caldisericales bacterium]
MPKITPYLWFENKAEEAVNFYVSIFRNSKILDITKFNGNDVGQDGAIVSITFQLEGQQFYALDGGPQFTFSPAVSFFISCETQQEIDHYWEKLSCGGEKQMCGWLKDKYGLSWQVVPAILGEMMQDSDAERLGRVTKAMLQMQKLDISLLKKAYEGK